MLQMEALAAVPQITVQIDAMEDFTMDSILVILSMMTGLFFFKEICIV